MKQALDGRTLKLGTITFYSIIDDMSKEESIIQSKLWGRMHKDYVVECKKDNRYRFFISETLYNEVG